MEHSDECWGEKPLEWHSGKGVETEKQGLWRRHCLVRRDAASWFSDRLTLSPWLTWSLKLEVPPPSGSQHCSLSCPLPLGPAKPPKGPRQHSLKATDSIPSFYRERNPWKAEKSGKVSKVRDRRPKKQKVYVRERIYLVIFSLTVLHCNSRTPI